jgi:antitoxin component of MazEF toxin-antitoxin module
MEVVRERIEQNGELRIPGEIMESLKLRVGEEVKLRVEGGRLIIESERVVGRKLRIGQGIIDELVENEELFEPEGV